MDVLNYKSEVSVCSGVYGVQKFFILDNVRLHVPDMVVDRNIRWQVDKGRSLEDAYAQVGWLDWLPPPGMRTCCFDIMAQKWLDDNMEWQISGWGHTCFGYHKCLEKYVLAVREGNKAGRMKVAPGLYSPSPVEEKCVKQRFAVGRDAVRAYNECKIMDILPTSPRIIEDLNRMLAYNLQERKSESIYTMLEVSSAMTPEQPHTPPDHHTATPSKTPYLIAAGIVGAVLLLQR